ncbi:MAG: prepilin-type N-terminal cleavage/methylation domain-containing protein [Leptolyngbya sp. SIO1D8]|nr:prepilin-type N-terminal cleavage/methylation domain-containing protein [Leptolyngbya sp. SIO1D8]
MKRLSSVRSSNADAGFTLLEILVVLIIAGVLAAIAAPSWTRYAANRQVQAVQGELRQLLEQAQTEARTKRETQIVEIEADTDLPTVTISDEAGATRTIELGNSNIRPGVVTLATDIEDIRFDYQGVVNNPFIIDVESNNTDRPHCVAAISLLGGVMSASDDECAELAAELGGNDDN